MDLEKRVKEFEEEPKRLSSKIETGILMALFIGALYTSALTFDFGGHIKEKYLEKQDKKIYQKQGKYQEDNKYKINDKLNYTKFK